MQKPSKPRKLRTFPANDWNQSELTYPLPQIYALKPKTTQSIFSNAEKLRKIDSRKINQH